MINILSGFSSITVVCAVGLASSLTGCASVVPAFDVPHVHVPEAEPVPTVSSIVIRVQCELVDIVGERGAEIDQLISAEQDIQAVVELSLSVTQDGQLAPTFSTMTGPFSFGTGIKIEQSRQQNFTEYLAFSLTQLRREKNGPECLRPADTNLAGTLGLKQMFQLADSSGPFSKWDKDGDKGVFGGSITFTVDKELTSTGPTWKLAHFSGPGPLLSAYDKNIDSLTVGFVRGPNAGKAKARQAAQQVIQNIKTNQIAGSLQLIANAR